MFEKKNTRRDRYAKPSDGYESKLLDLARVAHTRAGGRKIRFRAVMVSGDRKGKVGVGTATGREKGRGLVAGGVVRVICDLGGIKNISSKIIGRTGNKLNNANATIEALKKLKKPNEK